MGVIQVRKGLNGVGGGKGGGLISNYVDQVM